MEILEWKFESGFHCSPNAQLKKGFRLASRHGNSVYSRSHKNCQLDFLPLKPPWLKKVFSRIVVYPTIEDDDIPGKVKWKPGMKKKKSERVDATWNPKGLFKVFHVDT